MNHVIAIHNTHGQKYEYQIVKRERQTSLFPARLKLANSPVAGIANSVAVIQLYFLVEVNKQFITLTVEYGKTFPFPYSTLSVSTLTWNNRNAFSICKCKYIYIMWMTNLGDPTPPNNLESILVATCDTVPQ